MEAPEKIYLYPSDRAGEEYNVSEVERSNIVLYRKIMLLRLHEIGLKTQKEE